jgi:hypothetical protein
MRCDEFLIHFSDYHDGTLAGSELERHMRVHERSCADCARYAARVARSLTAFRSLSDIEPSASFREELQERLTASPEIEAPVTPAPAGVMVALMLVTCAALFLWQAGRDTTLAARPALRAAPSPVVIATPGPPFVAFTELSVPAFGGDWRAPGAGDPPFATFTVGGR